MKTKSLRKYKWKKKIVSKKRMGGSEDNELRENITGKKRRKGVREDERRKEGGVR